MESWRQVGKTPSSALFLHLTGSQKSSQRSSILNEERIKSQLNPTNQTPLRVTAFCISALSILIFTWIIFHFTKSKWLLSLTKPAPQGKWGTFGNYLFSMFHFFSLYLFLKCYLCNNVCCMYMCNVFTRHGNGDVSIDCSDYEINRDNVKGRWRRRDREWSEYESGIFVRQAILVTV